MLFTNVKTRKRQTDRQTDKQTDKERLHKTWKLISAEEFPVTLVLVGIIVLVAVHLNVEFSTAFRLMLFPLVSVFLYHHVYVGDGLLELKQVTGTTVSLITFTVPTLFISSIEIIGEEGGSVKNDVRNK